MNNSIKIADNTPEPLDEQLLGQSVRKVPLWDYANISKENYLSFSLDDYWTRKNYMSILL